MPVGLLSFGYNPITFPAQFLGNPNITITAINTSGGIVTSRDSDGSTYQTPFFIQASASAISATGTSAPYEDLEYQWLVTGPSSGDSFTRPTDSASVNSFSSQTGPEAAFAFRTAGTYTITLIIRGKNGGGYTSATVSKQISVAAFSPSNTFYFDPSAGGTNAGTLANPYNSMTSLNSAITGNPSNTLVLINRGTHYTGSIGLKLDQTALTGLRFDAYGSGAIPIIETSSGSDAPMVLANGGSSSPAAQADIVFSNISFLNSGVSAASAASVSCGGNNSATIKNIYFDNCKFELTYDAHPNHPAVVALEAQIERDLFYNCGFWKCDQTNSLTSTTISMAIQGSAKYWHFHVGGTPTGAGEDNAGDHHLYNDIKTHGLYRWISFGQTGTGVGKRSYCINGNWDGIYLDPSDHQVAQYIAYSENAFRYTDYGYDFGNRLNNTNALDSTTQFQYCVVEGNAFIGLDNVGFGCGLSITVRDNRSWGCVRGDWYAPATAGQVASVAQNTHLLSKLIRNKIDIPSTAGGNTVIGFSASGWTVPQVITDNVLRDGRTSGRVLQIVSSDQVSAGSTIDRNTYYSSSGDTTILNNNGTDISFATWQGLGWDANGNQTNPGWPSTPTQWSDLN